MPRASSQLLTSETGGPSRWHLAWISTPLSGLPSPPPSCAGPRTSSCFSSSSAPASGCRPAPHPHHRACASSPRPWAWPCLHTAPRAISFGTQTSTEHSNAIVMQHAAVPSTNLIYNCIESIHGTHAPGRWERACSKAGPQRELQGTKDSTKGAVRNKGKRLGKVEHAIETEDNRDRGVGRRQRAELLHRLQCRSARQQS